MFLYALTVESTSKKNSYMNISVTESGFESTGLEQWISMFTAPFSPSIIVPNCLSLLKVQSLGLANCFFVLLWVFLFVFLLQTLSFLHIAEGFSTFRLRIVFGLCSSQRAFLTILYLFTNNYLKILKNTTFFARVS